MGVAQKNRRLSEGGVETADSLMCLEKEKLIDNPYYKTHQEYMKLHQSSTTGVGGSVVQWQGACRTNMALGSISSTGKTNQIQQWKEKNPVRKQFL